MIRPIEQAEKERQREETENEKKQHHQDKEAHERSAPSGHVVYKAIEEEANDELSRTSSALFFSGLAAGLCMGFSLFSEAIIKAHLPHGATWAPLVSKLGYTVGFIIVIMARQQLFTENTLTPMLPLLKRKDAATFFNVMRLWGVVLFANLLGALLIALVATKTKVLEGETRRAMIEIAHKSMEGSFGTIFLRGIFAGWLIATLVWMLPASETMRLWVILVITYIIGVGAFAHIIAGAVDVFALGWAHERTWGEVFGNFIVPALAGNIVGGVTLSAGLNHAQVHAGGGAEE
jgi:formate/nitrite transporter FocA (FNT family)